MNEKEELEVEDLSELCTNDYSLYDHAIGQPVKVFLITGGVMTGIFEKRIGKHILVIKAITSGKEPKALMNLDHVTCITA